MVANKDAALLIVGHGSTINPDSSAPTWTHAREIQRRKIFAKVPAGPTYGDFLFNPCWDSLRGDKRFDNIVAAAKAASR